MYKYDEYNKEEVEYFTREGGAFLIRNGIVNTDSLEEIEAYKNRIEEEEEIEKIEGRRSFNIIKLNERSDDKMDYEFDDSAYNDNEDLKALMEIFLEEDIDEEEFIKAKKKMPEKLVAGLKEAFKILNEHKDFLDEDLKNAMQYISRILTKYPEPGKYPYSEKYPKKVKKSTSWQGIQDMLFGGHIPADDEEIEKSSKSNKFPSIVRALKIKEEAIDELEEEMERDAFDPDSRRI
ncbi:hypothetical protein ES707_13689 [subsurface metagenome]